MDELENELSERLLVIRVNIQEEVGRELAPVYEFELYTYIYLFRCKRELNSGAKSAGWIRSGCARAWSEIPRRHKNTKPQIFYRFVSSRLSAFVVTGMSNILRRLTFSLWYYFNPPWDSGISPPELFDFIEKHPPGNAIDIGCGTGTNVITLAKAGWQVTGVDFVPRAIRIAKRKARKAGIEAELHVRDATNLKGIPGPFDLALDMGCFHSLGDKKVDYLSELERVLAPGGHWLMYGFFNPDRDQTQTGLAEADLELIPASMTFSSGGRTGSIKENDPRRGFCFKRSGDSHLRSTAIFASTSF